MRGLKRQQANVKREPSEQETKPELTLDQIQAQIPVIHQAIRNTKQETTKKFIAPETIDIIKMKSAMIMRNLERNIIYDYSGNSLHPHFRCVLHTLPLPRDIDAPDISVRMSMFMFDQQLQKIYDQSKACINTVSSRISPNQCSLVLEGITFTAQDIQKGIIIYNNALTDAISKRFSYSDLNILVQRSYKIIQIEFNSWICGFLNQHQNNLYNFFSQARPIKYFMNILYRTIENRYYQQCKNVSELLCSNNSPSFFVFLRPIFIFFVICHILKAKLITLNDQWEISYQDYYRLSFSGKETLQKQFNVLNSSFNELDSQGQILVLIPSVIIGEVVYKGLLCQPQSSQYYLNSSIQLSSMVFHHKQLGANVKNSCIQLGKDMNFDTLDAVMKFI